VWAWAQERGKAPLKLFRNFRHPRVAKSGEQPFIKVDACPPVRKSVRVVSLYIVKYAPPGFVTAAAQRIHEDCSMLKHYPLRGNSFSKNWWTSSPMQFPNP
jgi:hypothetical protein